jgi:hypothetical protein
VVARAVARRHEREGRLEDAERLSRKATRTPRAVNEAGDRSRAICTGRADHALDRLELRCGGRLARSHDLHLAVSPGRRYRAIACAPSDASGDRTSRLRPETSPSSLGRRSGLVE